jgi:hypothetical protein
MVLTMKKLVIAMMVFCSLIATSGAAWCVNNGNGTVTVNGLVWLEDAGCLGRLNWYDAMALVKDVADGRCGLKDKSKAGDWRLATIEELKNIYSAKSQFKNVWPNYYWSSSTYQGNSAFPIAWCMRMDNGDLYVGAKGGSSGYYVWPVRAGQ